MSRVTVLIPTAQRPRLLETALQSVAQQTALSEVGRVLVSENAGDEASRAVCSRFPGLPIQYVFQDPQLTAVGHLSHLFRRDDLGEVVAFLCDDDWWSPHHLGTLLAGLESQADAVAAYAACLFVEAEVASHAEIYLPAVVFLQPPGPDSLRRQRLDREANLAACWLHTPFHFSAMVVRRTALRQAAARLSSAHPYYADRILFAGLALEGPTVFEPTPTACVRRHAGNYHVYTPIPEMLAASRQGMEEVARLSRAHGTDPAAFWAQRLAGLKGPVPIELANLLWNHLGYAGLKQSGLLTHLGGHRRHVWLRRVERLTWRYLRPLAPPILMDLYRRTRDRR